MRRSVAVGLVLLLSLGSALAADSNPQAPRQLDDDVTFIALAESGGTFMATMDDPGTTGSPDRESYFLWEKDGALRGSGSLDGSGCALSECETDPLAIALSNDGSRYVLATRPGGDGSNVLHFGTLTQGIIDTATVTVPSGRADLVITDLSMDATGTYIVATAALTDLNPDPQEPEPGMVITYRWEGNVVTQQWSTEVEGHADAVDVSNDGKIANVAADKHVRFSLQAQGNPSKPFNNQGIPGETVAVASSNSPSHRSVTGTDLGYFAVFDDTGNADPSFQVYQRRDSQSAVTAVAVTESGDQVAIGKQNGELYVYDLTFEQGSTVALVQHLSGLPGAVTDLDYTADGAYLALTAGTSVRLYTVGATLASVWSETLTNNLGQVEVDATGDRVLAANGTDVLRFDALHALEISGQPAELQYAPDNNVSLPLTVTNTGNRVESFGYTAAGPGAWSLRTDKDRETLQPGQSVTVDLSFDIPAGEAPDTYAVALHAVLDSTGGAVTKGLSIVVPETIHWGLETSGATSKGVAAGSTATFSVELTNRGNVAADPNITLSSSKASWALTHDAPDLLQPGELAFVTVSVTAPAGAANLDVAKILVRADDGTVLSLTATVGARFDVALQAAAPAFETQAGHELRIPLTLTNTGNTVDSFDVLFGNVPAGWTVGFATGPSPLQVGSIGANKVVHVEALVTPPADHDDETPLKITFEARSHGDTTQVASEDVLVTVLVEDTEGGNDRLIPVPGLPFVIALLVAVVLARRMD